VCASQYKDAASSGERLRLSPSLLTSSRDARRHVAIRRSGTALAFVAAILGGVVSLASIAWHHDLAQAAPVATLGTLNWQVSKMAFDALKVITLFYIKNLSAFVVHPTRFGQLRAPLVEQRVPDAEAAPAAAVVRENAAPAVVPSGVLAPGSSSGSGSMAAR
jgi:hypothetical protein